METLCGGDALSPTIIASICRANNANKNVVNSPVQVFRSGRGEARDE
jgi:hypothetical protein